jgi:predicted exporter
MSWTNAILRGLLIVAYFVIATVWLPDKVATLDSLASASRPVRDIVISGVWAGALIGGLWLLRVSQRRGLI